MMTNLFSIFDPSSSVFSLSWLTILLIVMFIPQEVWKITSPSVKVMKIASSSMHGEMASPSNKMKFMSNSLVIVLITSILIFNVLALYPDTFSPTSHLTITVPLSLSYWLPVILIGWMKNTSHMLSHLLPKGTPSLLMAFMVIIEIISSLIRPLTLCVRLTANLVAGHLLMSLLTGAFLSMPKLVILTGIFVPCLLVTLESAVAFIQAYVFVTLILLYIAEIK